MRILSELVFIPKTQESIGCCMTFPDFLHRAVVFNGKRVFGYVETIQLILGVTDNITYH